MTRERRTTRQRRVIHAGGGYCTHMDRTKRRCLSDLTGCFTHDEVHSHGLLGVNQTR
mgnify:CR=1 FL=1